MAVIRQRKVDLSVEDAFQCFDYLTCRLRLQDKARRTGRDRRPILEALLRMGSYLRRCQITEVSGLYLPRPDRAAGGFRRSLFDWEVRIDYVQHSVSALLGLRGILLREAAAATGSGAEAPAPR